MKLWRFENAWDYHEQGAFVTIAPTAKKAAAQVNAFVLTRPVPEGAGYWPGQYQKNPTGPTFTADEAEDVGLVFVVGGCDD